MTDEAPATGRIRFADSPVVPRLGAALGAALTGAGGLLGLTVLVLMAGHGSVLPIDRAAHTWSMHHRPGVLVTLAGVVTATGTGVFPYAAAVAAGLIAGRDMRRRLGCALGALVFLLLGQALRYGLMEAIGRSRPPVGHWATHASGFAFPSGHATTSTLMAGLLVAAIGHRARGSGAGGVAAVLLGCWAVAVGLSRILLGVHWATDVVAGWLFAACWLGLGAALIRTARPGHPG